MVGYYNRFWQIRQKFVVNLSVMCSVVMPYFLVKIYPYYSQLTPIYTNAKFKIICRMVVVW